MKMRKQPIHLHILMEITSNFNKIRRAFANYLIIKYNIMNGRDIKQLGDVLGIYYESDDD